MASRQDSTLRSEPTANAHVVRPFLSGLRVQSALSACVISSTCGCHVRQASLGRIRRRWAKFVSTSGVRLCLGELHTGEGDCSTFNACLLIFTVALILHAGVIAPRLPLAAVLAVVRLPPAAEAGETSTEAGDFKRRQAKYTRRTIAV